MKRNFLNISAFLSLTQLSVNPVLMSRKIRIFSTSQEWEKNGVKIYDYNGKKNICGSRIKQRRLALGLTQEDLAAQLQVENVLLARDCISRIEIGTRFVADYELKLLAEKLDVSVNWLLNIEDAKE